MQSAREQVHRETLEEEATHATDEARMVLPGVQAVLGFQLVAVFNQRFELFSPAEQVLHLGAFLLVALAMGLMMTPAAYHRQAERGVVTRRFVDLTSALLTASTRCTPACTHACRTLSVPSALTRKVMLGVFHEPPTSLNPPRW